MSNTIQETKQTCKFCSESDRLESHHVVPRRFGGSDDEENLVKVCPNCHSKLEDLYGRRFYKQLGVKKEARKGDKGWYLLDCTTCDRKSIDFKPTQTGKLNCAVCNSDSVYIQYRIDEKFSEVVDLENFTQSEGKDYYVWAAYTEEYSGKLKEFSYPRGQEAISFDSKMDAYERAAGLLMKDWCKDAAVFSFSHLTDNDVNFMENFPVTNLFDFNEVELTRKEDKVLDAMYNAENEFVDKESISDSTKIPGYKLDNILSGLIEQNLIIEDEDGFKVIYK